MQDISKNEIQIWILIFWMDVKKSLGKSFPIEFTWKIVKKIFSHWIYLENIKKDV